MDETDLDVEWGQDKDSPEVASRHSSIESPHLVLRPLCTRDRDIVQKYHEEWFPVMYDDEFYDELVQNRMVGTGIPLYTCCVFAQDQDGTEDLAACVVGAFGRARRLSRELQDLIISDSLQYTKVFYLMTLGTVQQYRQFGLATMLIQKCIRLVERDPSCGVVYLHVITFNTAAIRFYEKLGFHRVTEIKDYYHIDGCSYNCYLYAKYFHGNRGHKHIYKIVSRAIYALWHQLKKPLSLILDLEEVPLVTSSASPDPTVPL